MRFKIQNFFKRYIKASGMSVIYLLFIIRVIESETVTITTYYPAPYGAYVSILTTRDTWLARDTGNVGIGTTNPQAKLDVAGRVRIVDGTQADGRVLTSDANGFASWQPPRGIPQGGIIMYSGPWDFDQTGRGYGRLDGWALCNGNNGTPDLRDRFVMGTVSSANLRATGGANSYTLTVSNLPSHTDIQYHPPDRISHTPAGLVTDYHGA